MGKNILLFLISLIFFNLNAFGATLKFVHLSDVHYCTRKDYTCKQNNTFKLLSLSKKIFSNVISQINTMKNVRFVAITGDLVDVPQEDLVLESMSKLNILKSDWFLAFGNHDVGISTFNKNCYIRTLNEYSYHHCFANGYYAFSPKSGFRAIFLDSPIEGEITSNGYLSKDALNFLDNELSKNKNKTILIFMHHPLKEPFTSKSHRIRNANDVYNILNKYTQPIGIFTGHYHAMKIQQEKNLLHVSTPALVTYPFGYRVITVTNNFDKTIFNFEFHQSTIPEIQAKIKMIKNPREIPKTEHYVIEKIKG